MPQELVSVEPGKPCDGSLQFRVPPANSLRTPWVVTFKRRKCDLLIKLEFQNVAGTRTLLGVGSTPACSMRNLPRSRALVRDVNVDGKGNQSAFLLSGLTYGYYIYLFSQPIVLMPLCWESFPSVG